MNALQNMIVFYNNSDPDDMFHCIVGHLLQNITMLTDANIEDIAQKCYSSPATMSRLSRKLGYKGFSDFKNSISSAAKRYMYLNRIIPMPSQTGTESKLDSFFQIVQEQIRNMQSELDQAMLFSIVEKLHASEKVFFYSYGYVLSELTLQQNLLMEGKQSMLFSRAVDQAANARLLDKSCMVIMIMPDTRDAVVVDEILTEVKRNGACVLLLTTSRHAYFKKYADYSYDYDGIGYIVDMYRVYMYLDLISLVYRDLYLD